MQRLSLLAVLVISVLCGCHSDRSASLEKAKAEIVSTEKEFADLCRNEGIEAAFYHFAADDAVIHRDNQIIRGKEAIRDFYKNRPLKNATLTWVPDFVSAAASGDLGYTFGKFVFTSRDSLGKASEFKGVFHTVWKKQSDGTWRFVWD